MPATITAFSPPDHMTYDSARDWRVILFPAWLIVLHTLVITLPLWWLLKQFDPNVAGLVGGCMVLGYLTYEVFHACEHLPPHNPLTRLPWIRQMRRLHELHHRREMMQERNFNIVFPLMDYLFGTLYWEPEQDIPYLPRTPMTRMQHQIDIAGTPLAVLAYASTVTRWPEWHPSSLKINGQKGSLHAGARFEEDIRAGGRDGHLSWMVDEYLPGRRWSARAEGDHGLSLVVTYECEAEGDGTRFIRTLEYQFSGLGMRLANKLLLRRRIDRESASVDAGLARDGAKTPGAVRSQRVSRSIRFHHGVLLVIVAIGAFLLLMPTRVKPVAWTPQPAPSLTSGIYADNQRLKGLEPVGARTSTGRKRCCWKTIRWSPVCMTVG
jgi:hypothetical protein